MSDSFKAISDDRAREKDEPPKAKQTLDRIAKNAYEARRLELWKYIKDEFRKIDEYPSTQDINIALANLREYTREYNEILDRLESRELRFVKL